MRTLLKNEKYRGQNLFACGLLTMLAIPGIAAAQDEISITRWAPEAKLTVQGDSLLSFGDAVDIDGDWAVVAGQRLRIESKGQDGPAGAVYVFERTEDGWTQRARLDGDGKWACSRVDWVDLDMDRLLIRFRGCGPEVTAWSSMWRFQHQDVGWTSSDRHLGFGHEVASQGNMVLDGWPYHENHMGDVTVPQPASVSAWQFTPVGVTEIGEIIPSYDYENGGYGSALAISFDHILVGDPDYTTTDGYRAGLVTIYDRTNNAWQESGQLMSDHMMDSAGFGKEIALGVDAAIVMSDTDATFFKRMGHMWLPDMHVPLADATLLTPDVHIALYDDTALVGRKIYTRGEAGWTFEDTIRVGPVASVAVGTDMVLVGVPEDNAAYIVTPYVGGCESDTGRAGAGIGALATLGLAAAAGSRLRRNRKA